MRKNDVIAGNDVMVTATRLGDRNRDRRGCEANRKEGDEDRKLGWLGG